MGVDAPGWLHLLEVANVGRTASIVVAKQAVAAYERALENDPNSGRLLAMLGEAHFVAGEREQAATIFDRAISTFKPTIGWMLMIRYLAVGAISGFGDTPKPSTPSLKRWHWIRVTSKRRSISPWYFSACRTASWREMSTCKPWLAPELYITRGDSAL